LKKLTSTAVTGSFVLWSVASGFSMLGVFAVVVGMSYGGCVGLYPAVATYLFGTHHIGAMLGYLYTAVGVAALLGTTVTGFVFDTTGSYLGSILVSSATAIAAGLLTRRLQLARAA